MKRRPRRNGLRSVDGALTYRGRRLDGTADEFHQAVDLLLTDDVPQRYWEKVMASRDEKAHGKGAGS